MALSLSDFDSKTFGGVLQQIATFVKNISGLPVHWQAHVRCDDDGAIIAPKATAGGKTAGTATETADDAIAASTTRAGFRFQNLSDEGVSIWWQFAADGDAVVGESFELLAKATVVENVGDSHCRDGISVVTAPGTTANYVIQVW